MFDGLDDTKYTDWKIWAKVKLFRMSRGGVPDDATGSELMTWLVPGSPAFKCAKQVDLPTIMSAAGADRLWTVLDARFPELTATDKSNEAMEDLFNIKPIKGEGTGTFIGKVRDNFSVAREHRIIFNNTAKGLFMNHDEDDPLEPGAEGRGAGHRPRLEPVRRALRCSTGRVPDRAPREVREPPGGVRTRPGELYLLG